MHKDNRWKTMDELLADVDAETSREEAMANEEKCPTCKSPSRAIRANYAQYTADGTRCYECFDPWHSSPATPQGARELLRTWKLPEGRPGEDSSEMWQRQMCEFAEAYAASRLAAVERRIAELEKVLRSIGNTAGRPVAAYYSAEIQREHFLKIVSDISNEVQAALAASREE